MDWYYVESNQQVGPINEKDFHDMVRFGRIGNDTLVWREGMNDWQRYGQLIPTPIPILKIAPSAPRQESSSGGVVCSECGNTVPADEVIHYGSSWVCASCKPAFMQKLREGVARPAAMEYAGFWIRFAALFVDGVILWIVNMIAMLVVMLPLARIAPAREDMSAFLLVQGVLVLIQLVIGVTYEVWFLGKFGATPGKMACKVKVVMADGNPISYGRAFGRYFAKILSGMIFCIGYLMAAFDDEKRTLHDRICNTRVIRTR